MFDAALRAAGIHRCDRDEFIDRGDGLLALIHPVNPAVKALLLNRVVPGLSRFLIDYNTSLTPLSRGRWGYLDPTQMRAGETALEDARSSTIPSVAFTQRAGLRNVSANRSDGELHEMLLRDYRARICGHHGALACILPQVDNTSLAKLTKSRGAKRGANAGRHWAT